MASITGCTGSARELINAGADITYKQGGRLTALQHAAQMKHRDVVELLLAKANRLKKANK
jgi:ankyrin repeat protein